MRQHAPYPGARGHCVGAHANPLARKFGRLEHSALGIVRKGVVLAAADHDSRQQHVWLAVGLCLQIGDDRKFGAVICRLAHDLLEQIVRHFDLDEIEIDEIGSNLAAL